MDTRPDNTDTADDFPSSLHLEFLETSVKRFGEVSSPSLDLRGDLSVV